MPDYKQSSVAGTKWQRACRVVIENPLGAAPSIFFVEEEAINVSGKVVTTPVANLTASFNASDPLHMAIYNKLNELYTLLREARDQQEG